MVASSIQFHEGAEEDAKHAVEWYTERSPNAAAGFVEELNRAVASIAKSPTRWPSGNNNTRRFMMRRFPFFLIYSEQDSFGLWPTLIGTQNTGLSASDNMSQRKLTLYTRPDCPPCDWLKAWLRERNLAFEEHDVSTDKVAVFQLVRTYKSQSTPTLVIGDKVLIGFEPEKIEAALNDSSPTIDPPKQTK